jgi:DNA-binding LacI/PurR family transcriptional regulator
MRIEKYRSYLRAHGAGERIRVHITDQEPAPSYDLGRRIFAAGGDDLPTAIYATSDTTAIGLMQAAFQAGLAVPRQLSIVGYDDIDLAPYTIPPLTTVSQTGVEMGRAAAQLLFDMIDKSLDRADATDVVLTPELVVRRSTGPPPR